MAKASAPIGKRAEYPPYASSQALGCARLGAAASSTTAITHARRAMIPCDRGYARPARARKAGGSTGAERPPSRVVPLGGGERADGALRGVVDHEPHPVEPP